MAEELAAKHPDVTTITRKWGRWQHQVDYSRFAGNKLIRKSGVAIPEGVNDYGMVLEVDEEREQELAEESRAERANRHATDFLHGEVSKGKTVDEAQAAWLIERERIISEEL